MKYSVIIPVYNGGKYIRECVESVMTQNLPYNVEIEILIIDDGSTDNTVEICNSMFKDRLRTNIYSKHNEGLLLSRRFGLKQATGEWIVFLDADDYLENGFLKQLRGIAI